MDNSVNAKTLALTSLEWPPFAGESLPEQGASIFIVRQALATMGHELQVDFYPWNRAMRLAEKKGNNYHGYFPEYQYNTPEHLFSTQIGTSPLGLIERKDNPLIWQQVKDLNRYSLGVVDGYENIKELDLMIANGTQEAESVTADIQNLRKVAAKRIDGAVIDLLTFQYLLQNSSGDKLKHSLSANSQLLENKGLYVAFNDSPEGLFWRDTLNEGLDNLDIESLFEQYMKRHFARLFKP
ncbi:ABC transporter substrate-binding protein [Shewanella sp. SR44-3]|uniref:substrate-binding periplasmic protein n=1 Tax=Shewanella sp. SR44-3 TaxID=2760936 RepID=UPI00217584DE|nr:transporter substrate-binding domain-containing protein [Shewanella sp. SR44-3]